MIHKHVVLRELNGQLIAQYVVGISCDSCPEIIGFKTISGEELHALDGQQHFCQVCNLRQMGLACLVKEEGAK